MKRKAGLTGLMVVGATMAQLFLPNAAHAATVNAQYEPTTVSVEGHSSLHATHVDATDPWSGKQTAWVPVNVVQQTLKLVDLETSWDTKGFSFVKYPPGHSLAALDNPEAPHATKNQIQMYFVAGAPPSAMLPKITLKSSTAGIDTVYMPIYYVDAVLNHYWRMNAHWNGSANTWTCDFHPVW